MSKIYRRPMFRGGGKVSSYGNGIATGLAKGGRVGYVTGGEILENLSSANTLFTGGGGGAKKKILGMEIPGTGEALDKEGNPYDPKYIQEQLKGTRDELNTLLSFTPVGRSLRGLNVVRSPFSKFSNFRSGLPSASKVKDFFTKSPESLNRGLGPYKGKSPIGTDRFFGEKLRPAFQNTGQALKDLLGGAGKLKDYKTAIGVGGIGGTYGLAKGYEAFKERQKGIDPTSVEGQAGLTENEIELKKLREELYNERKGISTEPSSAEYKETLVDKKARLKKTAEGYEELLGDGIKKDSIFDAMVAGGTALMEGEGVASAIRGANKALDPIQNVKTAARKLALEEDISINKALAVAAAKDTETAKKIRALKAGGYTDREIADALAGKKEKDLDDYLKTGTSGYLTYVNEKIKPQSIVREIDDIGDVDTSKLKDGVHYIQDAFVLIQVENGKLKGQPKYLR